jgi:hypothetical protein
MSFAPPLASFVDLERYPIFDLGGDRGRQLVSDMQTQLTSTGVCVVEQFIQPDALERLVAEADELAPLAYLSDVTGTPYIEPPRAEFPAGHPRRTLVHTRLRAVAYDLFPSASGLRQLYESDELMRFLGTVLEKSPLYRYADPLGALNLAVMTDGDELGWHYDQTDFVVSLALQSSEEGGDFESARRIRSGDDEHYDKVARVLAGELDPVVETVPMRAGTLMLFEGRFSLHRVSPIIGPRPRYVALFAYDTKPGTVSSELLHRVRYGRAS